MKRKKTQNFLRLGVQNGFDEIIKLEIYKECFMDFKPDLSLKEPVLFAKIGNDFLVNLSVSEFNERIPALLEFQINRLKDKHNEIYELEEIYNKIETSLLELNQLVI